MFHHNWVKTTGHVLDSRIREMCNTSDDAVGGSFIPLHNYIVEFRAPDGQLVRLEVEQHIDVVNVGIGSKVPLLVSPDGTKAVIDKHDPSVNLMAVSKAREQADSDRFRKLLDGQ